MYMYKIYRYYTYIYCIHRCDEGGEAKNLKDALDVYIRERLIVMQMVVLYLQRCCYGCSS